MGGQDWDSTEKWGKVPCFGQHLRVRVSRTGEMYHHWQDTISAPQPQFSRNLNYYAYLLLIFKHLYFKVLKRGFQKSRTFKHSQRLCKLCAILPWDIHAAFLFYSVFLLPAVQVQFITDFLLWAAKFILSFSSSQIFMTSSASSVYHKFLLLAAQVQCITNVYY